MKEISLANRSVARLAAVTSLISARVRPVGNLLVGGDARVARLAYGVVDVTADDDRVWAKYDGDPKASRLLIPRLYKSVAKTVLDPETIDALVPELDDSLVPVIAWKRGVVMAGVIDYAALGDIFTQGYYGMRPGRGPLATGIGFVDLATQTLQMPRGLVRAGSVMSLDEFPEGGVIY